MKTEYQKGQEEILSFMERVLERLEMDENYSMDNAKEDLRDKFNLVRQ